MTRCANCRRVDGLFAALIWPACYGDTRQELRARVAAARLAVESLSHDGNCEEGEGAPCCCARGRALAALTLPPRAPVPRGLTRAELVPPEARALVDELLGRLAGAGAQLRRYQRAAGRALAEVERLRRRKGAPRP